METKNKFLKEAVVAIISLAPAVFTAAYWNDLPEQLPMHWNIKGEVDGYGPKYLTPLLSAGLFLLLFVIPFFDPKKKNYKFFETVYFKIRVVFALFFTGISLMTIYYSLGYDIDTPRILVYGILVLFALIGNYLVNVKPNWFIGIRTPWTMENEEVWRKTHRTGGRLWFFGALALIALSPALSFSLFTKIMVIAFGIMVVFPIIHSYLLYKKLKNGNPG